MPKKAPANIAAVLVKAQQTAPKTKQLMREAHDLHDNIEQAHNRARQLHEQIRDKRQRARNLRERRS